MRFLLVPDSFKGSIDAKRACEIMQEGIEKSIPASTVRSFPALDGGEGSVENLVEIFRGKFVKTETLDGNFKKKETCYGAYGDTAVIAVANTSGLPDTTVRDPRVTTTYGVGQQIKDALEKGFTTILLALGGSSTNDGGAGAAAALGVTFYKENGEAFVPTGGTLREIATVDVNALRKTLRSKNARFIALSDVNNPLLGERGCSYVYAKQKGATTREMQDELERNMRVFYEKTAFLGVKEEEEGNGAAGGLGYFVRTFLQGEYVSGADYFLDTIGFEGEAEQADFVLCGEGKFDKTSAQGKICGRIRDRAKKVGAKTVVFCGVTETDEADGIAAIYPIADPKKSLDENMQNAERNLACAVSRFCADVKNGRV